MRHSGIIIFLQLQPRSFQDLIFGNYVIKKIFSFHPERLSLRILMKRKQKLLMAIKTRLTV